MKKLDFTNIKPDFETETSLWYFDEYFTKYLAEEQAENLPSLKNLGCFVVNVKEDNAFDYVLIDDQQNILASFPYTIGGLEQMEVRINIMKISKHYDDNE